VGLVTNFREFGRRRRSAPSRGGLIPGYLAGDSAPEEYLRTLETDAPGFAGFNLLLADRGSLWYASNRADQFARELPPGIYGLSNEFLDTPWPKLVRVRARFDALMQSTKASDLDAFDSDLFAMLADREPAPPDSLPPGDLSPEWARKLLRHSCWIGVWHTLLDCPHNPNEGALRITERRFDASGAAAGQSEHVLNDADES
jgi:uncharacterized protein with NRDE domain